MSRLADATEAFGNFVDGGTPVLFVLGTVLLSTISSGVEDLLKATFGDSPPTIASRIFIGMALLVLGVAAKVWRMRRGFKVRGGVPPPPKQGLICLVSNKDSVLKAVEHHLEALQRVWLIHTDGSHKIAQELQQEIRASYPDVKVKLEPIGNPFLQDDVEQAVTAIFDSLGPYNMKETDVISDFTGMTKPATAGMIVACLRRSRMLEYVPCEYERGADDQLKPLPEKALDPVYIHIVR